MKEFLQNLAAYAKTRGAHDLFAVLWAFLMGSAWGWLMEKTGSGDPGTAFLVAFVSTLIAQGMDCVCERCGRDGVVPRL